MNINTKNIGNTTADIGLAIQAGAKLALINEAYQLLLELALSITAEYPMFRAFILSGGIFQEILIGLVMPSMIIFLCDTVDVPHKQGVKDACLLVLQARTFTTLTPILKKIEEPLKKLASLSGKVNDTVSGNNQAQ